MFVNLKTHLYHQNHEKKVKTFTNLKHSFSDGRGGDIKEHVLYKSGHQTLNYLIGAHKIHSLIEHQKVQIKYIKLIEH